MQLAAAGQVESPPPLAVTVLLPPVGPSAASLTLIGTLMYTVPATPASMVQPERVVAPEPDAALHVPGLNVPPEIVTGPLDVMPVPKLSFNTIGSGVGPFVTAIDIE
jgi:hypothetical protein